MSGIDGEGQRLLGQLLKLSGLSGRQAGEDAPEKSLSEKFNSVTRWFGRRSSLMAPLAEQQLAQLQGSETESKEKIAETHERQSGRNGYQGGHDDEQAADLQDQVTSMILGQGVSVQTETQADRLLDDLSPNELKNLAIGGLGFSAKEMALHLHQLLGAPSLDVESGEYLVDPFPAAVRSHIDQHVSGEDLKSVIVNGLEGKRASGDVLDTKIRPTRTVLGIANRLPEAVHPGKTQFNSGDYIFLGSESDYPHSLDSLTLHGRELKVARENGNWMVRGLEFGDNQLLHGHVKLSDSSIVPLTINISVAG